MCRPACAPETGPHASATACCAEMPVGWSRTSSGTGEGRRDPRPPCRPVRLPPYGAVLRSTAFLGPCPLPCASPARVRRVRQGSGGVCARRRCRAARMRDAGCGRSGRRGRETRREVRAVSLGRDAGIKPAARGGWRKKRSSGPEDRYGWPGPGEEEAAAGPGRNGLRCAAERTAHSTTWSPPQRATGTEDGVHGPGPEARRRRCARAPVTRRVWKRTSLRAPVRDRSRRCPGRAASEETGWHIVGPEPSA